MKKILFLILFPLFSFAQDTIIIKKVFIDPDTVWQVKQVIDADNSSLTVFEDSNLIIPFLTNDLVDDTRWRSFSLIHGNGHQCGKEGRGKR
jgi:hypothetical protein